jgi:anti-sigma B factor antagonist
MMDVVLVGGGDQLAVLYLEAERVATFAVQVLHMDGSVTLGLRGELDVAGLRVLEEALQPLSSRYDASQVVLDCTALRFMDAGGLRALIGFARRYGDTHERVTLRGVRMAVRRLLDLTGTDALFNIEDLEDAVRHGEPHDSEEADV